MILLTILPLIVLFLLWVLVIAWKPEEGDGSLHLLESFIQAGLFWSAFLALGTEILSVVGGLTIAGVAILWTLALFTLCAIHYRKKSFPAGLSRLRAALGCIRLGWLDSILLGVIISALGIILITAVMSPPNIHDVLTYHLSRVMHWVQNRSLLFFPTSITWQLYYPPFSEFSQLHWQLLAGGDTLSAFHQWYSLGFILVTVVLIAKRLGANRRGQLLAALFMVSVPIVALQASSGKNDIVLTFFYIALAYFVVKAAFQPLGWLDWVSSSLAVALGLMTKGHFVFFAIPLLIWLLITMLKRSGWQKTVLFAGIGILCVLLLNGGHWIRNTQTFGDPTNTNEASFIINGRFGVDVLVSNLSRNMALQLSSFNFVNQVVENLLTKLHGFVGIPLFDPDATLGPQEFFHMRTREEVAGNPVHFGLTGLIVLGLLTLTFFRRKHNLRVGVPLILALIAISGLVIFSAVFRWQAWGTRYFIFYYALFAPVLGYLASFFRPRWMTGIIGLVLVVVMVNPLINNYSRSFSWSPDNRNSIWRLSSRGLRFANHRIFEGAILEMTHLMEISGCRTYGMSIGGNSPEYLIWGTLTPDSRDYFLEHVEVDNLSAVHATENFNPCGIIILEADPPQLALQGDYRMVEGWQLEGYEGQSLILYLKPEAISKVVE